MADEGVKVRLQAVQDSRRASGDLRPDVHAVAPRFLGEVVHLVAFIGARRRRHERDGKTGRPRETLEPAPFVVVAQMIGHDLVDAVRKPFHGHAHRKHLVGAGEGAGHMHALLVLVQQSPRRREAECARGHAVAHDLRHRRDLVGVRRVVGVAALAQHVSTHRAVRNMRTDIDRARHALNGIEIFGEVFPLPVDAFGERGTGNVFDAFHQLDEELVIAGSHRRKAHAAIAHHGGRDAMPARRREHGIPARLAVIMRMDVDPAGRDQHALGIEFAACGSGDRAHFDDTLPLNGDIALERRTARAVDNRAVANDQIVHGGNLGMSRRDEYSPANAQKRQPHFYFILALATVPLRAGRARRGRRRRSR